MKVQFRIKKLGRLVSTVALCMVFVQPIYAGMGNFFLLAETNSPEGSVSVAFDGTNFLAAIVGGTTSPDWLSWQRFDSTGTLLGQQTYQGRSGSNPMVSFGGGAYLFIWNAADGSGISQVYGQRVSCEGEALGSPFQISNSPGSGGTELDTLSGPPYGGGKFLVVWVDFRGSDKHIYGQLVDSSGTLFGAEIPIAANPANGEDKGPSVDFDGTNFLVAFTAERRAGMYDGEDIYGQFVSPSGTLIGGNFVIDENDFPSSNPTAICWDGEKYTVLFHDAMIGGNGVEEEQWDIIARFVAANGTVSSNRIAVATSPSDNEEFPSLAFDGTNYLVTIHFEDGVTTNTPFGTNMVARGRFYDQQMNPETSWFTLLDPSGSQIPIAKSVFGKTHFAVSVTQFDENFLLISSEGVMVDASAPRWVEINPQGTSCYLSITNLFLGTTNQIQYISDLTSTNGWIDSTAFICTTSTTNLTEPVHSGTPSTFYRLLMK